MLGSARRKNAAEGRETKPSERPHRYRYRRRRLGRHGWGAAASRLPLDKNRVIDFRQGTAQVPGEATPPRWPNPPCQRMIPGSAGTDTPRRVGVQPGRAPGQRLCPSLARPNKDACMCTPARTLGRDECASCATGEFCGMGAVERRTDWGRWVQYPGRNGMGALHFPLLHRKAGPVAYPVQERRFFGPQGGSPRCARLALDHRWCVLRRAGTGKSDRPEDKEGRYTHVRRHEDAREVEGSKR